PGRSALVVALQRRDSKIGPWLTFGLPCGEELEAQFRYLSPELNTSPQLPSTFHGASWGELPVPAKADEKVRCAKVLQSKTPETMANMTRSEARCGLMAQWASPDSTARVFGALLQPALEPPDRLRWRSRGGARRLQFLWCALSAALKAR